MYILGLHIESHGPFDGVNSVSSKKLLALVVFRFIALALLI